MQSVGYRPRLTQWCLNGCVFFHDCLCAKRERKAWDRKLKLEVAAIVQAVKAYRFHYSNEKELQEAVAQALGAAKIPFEREKKLPDDYGTIDFLVDGRIGVEIKIKGSPSAVTRQLIRYLKCDVVAELVLVTGRAKLGNLPREILGKTLTVVTLWETFL